MPLGIRLSVNNVRVEYDGVKGIMTVGLSRKEHGRSTAVAENTIRDQLWEGGNICFGHWGQSKDGMQCRGSEGMYLTNNGYFTQKGTDGVAGKSVSHHHRHSAW